MIGLIITKYSAEPGGPGCSERQPAGELRKNLRGNLRVRSPQLYDSCPINLDLSG